MTAARKSVEKSLQERQKALCGALRLGAQSV